MTNNVCVKAHPDKVQLWAINPLVGVKVHYWHRKQNGVIVSACNIVSSEGGETNLQNPNMWENNYQRCKNCARKLKL